MGKYLTILFIFFGLSINAQNISTYNQIWLSGFIKKDIKKFNFRLDGSYRSLETFKFNRQFIIREITSYTINSHFQIGLGPALSWQYPFGNVKPVFEFRPTAQAIYIKNLSKGKFENNQSEISFRLRYELRYYWVNNKFSSSSNRGRLMLKSKIALTEKISAIISEEIMLQKIPNDQFRYQTNRIYLGFNLKLKDVNLELGYIFQHINRLNNNIEIDNVLISNVGNN